MFIVRKIIAFFNDLIITIVFAGAIFVFIYALLFRPFQVNGQSMYPTYYNGEYVLTNLIANRIANPHRGDVIVFESPTNKEKDFIKRVIGLPDDRVKIENNTVYINNNVLPEPYLRGQTTYTGAFMTEGEEVVVPQGQYFVMGDNREFSSDSREWGFVTKDKIIGYSMFVYWPVTRMRLERGVDYSKN